MAVEVLIEGEGRPFFERLLFYGWRLMMPHSGQSPDSIQETVFSIFRCQAASSNA